MTTQGSFQKCPVCNRYAYIQFVSKLDTPVCNDCLITQQLISSLELCVESIPIEGLEEE